jgi:hypothetical protein
VIKRRDGSEEVVVAGGFCEGWLDTSEIFSLLITDTVQIFSLDKSQWRSGIE